MIAPYEYAPITVERASAAEIEAMSLVELSRALAEVMAAVAETTRFLTGARCLVADAKKRVLLVDHVERNAARADLIGPELAMQLAKDRLRLLREQKSALQTAMRASS